MRPYPRKSKLDALDLTGIFCLVMAFIMFALVQKWDQEALERDSVTASFQPKPVALQCSRTAATRAN